MYFIYKAYINVCIVKKKKYKLDCKKYNKNSYY